MEPGGRLRGERSGWYLRGMLRPPAARAAVVAWIALLAFVRLSTRESLFPEPLSMDGAMNRVDAWLAAPASVVLEPTVEHGRVLRSLLAPLTTAGNLVNDIFTLFSSCICGVEKIVSRNCCSALILHNAFNACFIAQIFGKRSGILCAFALTAVHIFRKSHNNKLGFCFFGCI